jgi:phage gp16-like protein
MVALAPAPDRRPMLAKIAIARKQLALHEDSYRAILQRITGQDSATKLDGHGLHAVLEEFKRLGWKAKKGALRPLSPQAQVRMIYAVWGDIRPHLVSSRDDSALRSFVQRQTKTDENPAGVSAPEFLKPADANKVLEGLKAWRVRLRRQADARARDAARFGGEDA